MKKEIADSLKDALAECPGVAPRNDQSVNWTPLDKYAYRPPHVTQTGVVAFGDDPAPEDHHPVWTVVLKRIPTNTSDVRPLHLSTEIVYEAAKHDCRIRFYPEDHENAGEIWFGNVLTHQSDREGEYAH